MYEDVFVERLFQNGVITLNRAKFVEAVEGVFQFGFDMFKKEAPKKEKKINLDEETDNELLEEMQEGAVVWLFSPKSIRQIFRQHYKNYSNLGKKPQEQIVDE